MTPQAFWLLFYTVLIAGIFFVFGRLSTVGHPLRKAPRAPRMPQDASKSPPPQDPTPAPIVAPGASQAVEGLLALSAVVNRPQEEVKETLGRFSWNPDCPMCGKPDKVVMASEDAFKQDWHCYPCNHWWRT